MIDPQSYLNGSIVMMLITLALGAYSLWLNWKQSKVRDTTQKLVEIATWIHQVLVEQLNQSKANSRALVIPLKGENCNRLVRLRKLRENGYELAYEDGGYGYFIPNLKRVRKK